MNWMLLTALALAFGLILGNLMLLRYLDKLPGNKAATKPDRIPGSSAETRKQQDKQASSTDSKSTEQRPDNKQN